MKEELDTKIEKMKVALKKAEYILIGGGAGLSTAAGLPYSGTRFINNFGEFVEKYGMQDMYSAGFYPFRTQEAKWAYWAKHICLNRYDMPPTELYKQIWNIVKAKPHFVITTNVDHQFYKADFVKENVFAVQGDYGYFQCAKACHNTLYDNENIVQQMVAKTADCKIPTDLVPKCPSCRGLMEVNIRKDGYFVQDTHWYDAQENYLAFLQKARRGKLVLLELGVGFNTPGIIRFPFEEFVNEDAILIRINKSHVGNLHENENKFISLQEDIASIIMKL